MRPFTIFASVVILTACGSNNPDPTTDASTSPSSEGGTTKPPLDPTCRATNGCAIYVCNCSRPTGATATSEARSDQPNATCLSGEATCKKECDLAEMAIDGPVVCSKVLDAGPQVDASALEDGRPGGACNKVGEKCLVMMCECNDGTTRSPVSAPCNNGICGGLPDACPFACRDKGGWGGKGTP